jgi:hypothetical protein
MPVRIQLSRAAGWRKPDGAVVVSRPSKWGNPHVRESLTAPAELVDRYLLDLLAGRLPITIDDVRRELRGKDLCCWCPASQPCHADVLLEIANS